MELSNNKKNKHEDNVENGLRSDPFWSVRCLIVVGIFSINKSRWHHQHAYASFNESKFCCERASIDIASIDLHHDTYFVS